MTRGLGLLVALGLLAGAAPGQPQNAYPIKLKDKAQGDAFEVDEQSTEQGHVKVADAAGKALFDKAEYKTRRFAYRETVLEKPAGEKRAIRLRRDYTRAEVTAGDGKGGALPYQGKTVLIEKQDGKYRFRVEGGNELTGDEAKYLDEEFNKKQAEGLDVRKVLLPAKPIRPGESWKIDPGPLVKELTKGDEAQAAVDEAKATATGRLLEVYEKDGRRFGRLEFAVELPLKEFTQGGEKLVLEPGSVMKLTMAGDVCIDGSANSGVMKTGMNLTATSLLDNPDGGKAKLTINSKISGQEQRKELPRK